MKEGAARAVLREAWLRGHRCVELQRDGRRTIFVCTRCATRCYSDGALVDHLQGNLHARLSALISTGQNAATIKTGTGDRSIMKRGKEQEDGAGGGLGDQDLSSDGLAVVPHSLTPRDSHIVLADASGTAEVPKTPLQWTGSGELFFSVRCAGAAPLVEASWFCWRGKGKPSPEAGWQSGQAGGIVYAVVMFPYSDMIGRGGNWKPWFDTKHARNQPSETEDLMLLENSKGEGINSSAKPTSSALALTAAKSISSSDSLTESGKEASQSDAEQQKNSAAGRDSTSRVLRRGWKRKKPRVLERLCFICHQRMTAGKDVAALLNLQTKQMVCGSRNKRGVFHVYHSSCLIDWISICEVKTFSGALDYRIDRTRKLLKSRRAIIEQTMKRGSIQDDGNTVVDGAVFCPECQGTGLKVRGSQLERPRYRLAQVFDWILELIQSRKAWSENPKREGTSNSGLLFRDDLKGAVQSRGMVHYYSGCAELLAGNGSDK